MMEITTTDTPTEGEFWKVEIEYIMAYGNTFRYTPLLETHLDTHHFWKHI